MNNNEKKIVSDLYNTLKHAGWNLFKVFDGEESYSVSAKQELFDAVDSVEYTWAYFRKNGKTHGVMLIPGNDGDIISDYPYNNEEDEFQRLVESAAG
jgi:hypothetical protein